MIFLFTSAFSQMVSHSPLFIYIIDMLKNRLTIYFVPGKFLLSYLPRIKVHHEYVSVTPDGFR